MGCASSSSVPQDVQTTHQQPNPLPTLLDKPQPVQDVVDLASEISGPNSSFVTPSACSTGTSVELSSVGPAFDRESLLGNSESFLAQVAVPEILNHEDIEDIDLDFNDEEEGMMKSSIY